MRGPLAVLMEAFLSVFPFLLANVSLAENQDTCLFFALHGHREQWITTLSIRTFWMPEGDYCTSTEAHGPNHFILHSQSCFPAPVSLVALFWTLSKLPTSPLQSSVRHSALAEAPSLPGSVTNSLQGLT